MRSQLANKFIMGGFLLFAALPVNAINALSDHSIHPDSTYPFFSSISLEMGILNGNTREYVYDHDYQLSKLDWDLKPVYYGGVTIGLQFFGSFFFNAGFWTGINTDVGYISDYDYVNYDGVLTHYSKHKCLLQKADILDGNIGYSYSVLDDLSLSVLLGYHYIGLKVAAESGYYEYPPGSEQLPFYGVGISNEQMYNIPYAGLGATWLFFDRMFFIQLFGMYSMLVSCDGLDNHYRRKMEYHYKIKYGEYISLTASLGFKINKYTSIIVSAQHSEATADKGETYYVDLTTGNKTITFYGSGAVDYKVSGFMLSVDHLLMWR